MARIIHTLDLGVRQLQDEGGILIDSQGKILNFTGLGVTSSVDPSNPDQVNVDIPGTGGAEDTTTLYGRDSANVTGGSYLSTADGVSSAPGNSAPVYPFAATIVAMSVGFDGAPAGTWEVDIQVNGVTQVTISGTAAVDSDTSLSISVAADQRINVRMAPTSVAVARPVVELFIQRP